MPFRTNTISRRGSLLCVTRGARCASSKAVSAPAVITWIQVAIKGNTGLHVRVIRHELGTPSGSNYCDMAPNRKSTTFNGKRAFAYFQRPM